MRFVGKILISSFFCFLFFILFSLSFFVFSVKVHASVPPSLDAGYAFVAPNNVLKGYYLSSSNYWALQCTAWDPTAGNWGSSCAALGCVNNITNLWNVYGLGSSPPASLDAAYAFVTPNNILKTYFFSGGNYWSSQCTSWNGTNWDASSCASTGQDSLSTLWTLFGWGTPPASLDAAYAFVTPNGQNGILLKAYYFKGKSYWGAQCVWNGSTFSNCISTGANLSLDALWNSWGWGTVAPDIVDTAYAFVTPNNILKTYFFSGGNYWSLQCTGWDSATSKWTSCSSLGQNPLSVFWNAIDQTQWTPINGNWSPVSTCSVSCGGGTQTRTCNNPSPLWCGAECQRVDGSWTTSDNRTETTSCNTQPCPIVPSVAITFPQRVLSQFPKIGTLTIPDTGLNQVDGTYVVPYIQTSKNVPVSANAINLPSGGKVRFKISRSGFENIVVDEVSPFETVFSNVPKGEYIILAEMLDSLGNPISGASDQVTNVGVGDVVFAVGDSITAGYYTRSVSGTVVRSYLDVPGSVSASISSDKRNFPQLVPNDPTLYFESSWTRFNNLYSSQRQYPVFVANEGWVGIRSNNYLETYDDGADTYKWRARIALLKPNIVFIHLGANDARMNVSPSEYNTNIINIINRVKTLSPGVSIYLSTPSFFNYTDPATGRHYYDTENQYLPHISSIINSDPQVFPGPDFYNFFREQANREFYYQQETAAPYTGQKVIHPNQLGAEKIGEMWFNSTNCLARGDLNCSGLVDAADLSILLSDFKTTQSRSDIDNSGEVNTIDFTILISNYGR